MAIPLIFVAFGSIFAGYLAKQLVKVLCTFDVIYADYPVFHFIVLCCSQSGDHTEKNVANFYYTPYMKRFLKKKDPSKT
jgi:hypothetical protein